MIKPSKAVLLKREGLGSLTKKFGIVLEEICFKCTLGAKGYGFVVVVDFQLTFSFFVVELEDSQCCFYGTEL